MRHARLTALLAGLAAFLGAAAARAQVQADEDLTPIDEVDVVGQAPPGAVIGDIPPENSLNPRDIRSYGVGTVSELLDEIALQTASGQSRDGSGPVILVNGRRISGVNEVSDLPTEAILRVDILPEEVALKYGYSSDQKVVNVILRRRFAATTAEASAGRSTEGDDGRLRGDGTLTRIRDNRRFNVALAAQTQGSITEADRGIEPATAEPASDPAHRTLQPSRETYSANAVFAAPLTDTLNASTNVTAARTSSHSLNGLSAATLEPLDQDSDSTTIHLGSSLNRDLPGSWRFSLIGAYDHANTNTTIERATASAPSPDTARGTSDSANLSMLATRKVFALPAGDALVSLQGGAATSTAKSQVTGARASPERTLTRSSANAQVSVDLPVTKRNAWGGAIGSLTANVNGSATAISDFDTLKTYGYGLNWSPVSALSVIAAVSQDRRAPTIQQLINPATTVLNTSVYDYVTGQSVLVTSTTGGNPLLDADDRRTFKLAATYKPFANRDFTLTGNYSDSRTKNAILALPGAGPLIEAAFPDRFVRDEDGDLVSIDVRPINVASTERSSLRWGFNLTQVLREPRRPAPGARPRPPRPPDGSTPAADAAPRPNDSPDSVDEVVVAGQRPGDDANPASGNRRGLRGFGDGGPPGGPPGGARGFAGGGPGGPGRFGRGGGFGGGDDGARLQLSVYHTWLFRNEVTLRDGLAPVDLLGGGNLGAPPPARHQVQMNGGVTDNGLGVRLTGQWRSASSVGDSQTAISGLRFGALATLDLRLFADLGQRFPGKPWTRGLRTTLSVQNLFDQRQRVTDASGAVPFAYQPGYLDPVGRVVLLSARKIM